MQNINHGSPYGILNFVFTILHSQLFILNSKIMHPIISDLNWRYAVKKYDSSKKIPKIDLDILKEAIRLAPSSIGLQGYKVLIIENKELRNKLKEASHGQNQITEASHLFVFCYYSEIKDEQIDQMMESISALRNVSLDSLEFYREKVKHASQNQAVDKINVWLTKQVYIALAQLLQTAAQLKIDATPMEGFDAQAFEEILNLKQKNLKVAVICTLGYRSTEDKYQYQKKFRKPIIDLFEEL